jgi:sulfane dehydrogenase subunit SoxC
VSVDGGKTWKEAKIDGAVHAKAHTRFNYDWAWNGEEAMIMSRTTDETGDVQPSLAELTEHWGMKASDWHKPERPRAIHMNAIQPWLIARDGSISDAMFA